MADTIEKTANENAAEQAAETIPDDAVKTDADKAPDTDSSPPEKKPKKEKKERSSKKKKKGSEEESEGGVTADGQNMTAADINVLRRSAKETKKYAVMRRCTSIVMFILIAIIIVVYAVSYFYDKFGSFTVKINKYDMVQQGLSLSENPDFESSLSRLNADIVYDMTNISGQDIPDNVDRVNGSHNGDGYIAYTFYLSNSGRDTITYEAELTMENVTGGVDEAIRVAVYRNGEKTVYGKTKSSGGGIESDCDSEFASASIVSYEKYEDFAPGAQNKYTVVIWLEGNDPDCTDDIIGGTMKLGMNFKIIENT